MLWTDLSCTEIRDKLKEKGFLVGTRIVKKLLYKNNFKKRKIGFNYRNGANANYNPLNSL